MDLHKLDAGSFPYTPLFCEENIWWLARELQNQGIGADRMQVLFFANPLRQVVMFEQRSAAQGQAIVWDYHVVLCVQAHNEHWVLDFDTRLPFVSRLGDYLQRSFPEQSSLDEQYRVWVRVIPAQEYIARFYSDRSHMKGVVPEADFPDWPVIQPDNMEQAIALSDYWDMEKSLADGSYTYLLLKAFKASIP